MAARALTAAALVLLAGAVGLRLEPDVTLYTVGGLGVFPSPIGRALGTLGPWALVLAGAGAVALFTARARAMRPAAIIAGLPVLVCLLPTGVDALGAIPAAASLLWALHPGRAGRSALAAIAAALVHPATLLVTVPGMALSGARGLRALALALAGAGVLVAIATPYSALVAALPGLSWGALGATSLMIAVTVPPLLAGLVYDRRPYASALLLALGVGQVAHVGGDLNVSYLRYALPIALLALVWPEPRAGLPIRKSLDEGRSRQPRTKSGVAVQVHQDARAGAVLVPGQAVERRRGLGVETGGGEFRRRDVDPTAALPARPLRAATHSGVVAASIVGQGCSGPGGLLRAHGASLSRVGPTVPHGAGRYRGNDVSTMVGRPEPQLRTFAEGTRVVR